MVPTEVVFWRLVTEVFLGFLMGWSHDVRFYSRLPMILGLHNRLTFLEVAQRPLGPAWVVLSWAFSHHVTCLLLGLRQMVLMGSLFSLS